MKKKIFNFRLEDNLMNKFRLLAQLEGRTYSEILRTLIINYINKNIDKYHKLDKMLKKNNLIK